MYPDRPGRRPQQRRPRGAMGGWCACLQGGSTAVFPITMTLGNDAAVCTLAPAGHPSEIRPASTESQQPRHRESSTHGGHGLSESHVNGPSETMAIDSTEQWRLRAGLQASQPPRLDKQTTLEVGQAKKNTLDLQTARPQAPPAAGTDPAPRGGGQRGAKSRLGQRPWRRANQTKPGRAGQPTAPEPSQPRHCMLYVPFLALVPILP